MVARVKKEGLKRPGVHSTLYDLIEERNKSHDCLNPQRISIVDKDDPEYAVGLQDVRCRKCSNCMRMRQAQWMYRGAVEFATHERTWFVTLTWKDGNECDYEEVKKFFKRLRKKHGAFRYLCTEEKGEKNERLHWHILLHCSDSITWRAIASEWSHGHIHCKLARTSGLASYVAKYAAKGGRIRASRFYGEESGCHHVKGWPTGDFDRFFETGAKSAQLESIEFKLTRRGIVFTDIQRLAEQVAKGFTIEEQCDDIPW